MNSNNSVLLTRRVNITSAKYIIIHLPRISCLNLHTPITHQWVVIKAWWTTFLFGKSLFNRISCCVSTVALGALSISHVLKKAIRESRQAQKLSKLGHSSQPNYEVLPNMEKSASDSSVKASKEGHKIIVQTINRMSTFCSFSCSLYNRCNMKSCYQWRVIQSDGSNKKNVSKSRIS